ncbi:MAG: hypothetical protein JNJ73_01945 [Hyphomonadaceae bacterium]|nr:hypothetical protein [Hyphomonadaceae bacterium]
MFSITAAPAAPASRAGARRLAGARARVDAWMVAAALGVAALACFVVWMGPTTVAAAPWDIFVLLDGGWRMLQGQTPSTDFYSPTGPLIYWLIEQGMRIVGPSFRAGMVASLIFLAAIAPLAIFVFFRKFASPLAFLLTIAFAVLAVATRPLGYEPEHMSYLMPYNRMGWIVFAILCAHLFMGDRAPAKPRAGAAALFSGALVALLFLDKITFALGGLAALAFALVLRPQLRAKAWLAIVGFAAVCALAWTAFGFDIPAYLSDLGIAAAAQTYDNRIECLKRVIKFNALQGAVLTAAWVALIAWPVRRGWLAFADAARTTLAVGFVFGMSLLISIFNTTELTDIPHYLAAAMLVDTWLRRGTAGRRRTRLSYAAAIGVLIALFTAFPRDLIGFANTYAAMPYRNGAAPESQRFASRTYGDLVILHTTKKEAAYSRAHRTPDQINDGLALLRAHLSPDSRLVSLTLGNPFSLALELPPARGAPLWLDIDTNFTRESLPPPERIFGDADFVIHPRPELTGCCMETVHVLLELNGPYLERRFLEVGRSRDWILLKRRPDAGAAVLQPH